MERENEIESEFMKRDINTIFYRMNEMSSVNSCIDMHMHTTWTDGNNSLEEMLFQAERNGLRAIAITDHIRANSLYFPSYISEIEKIRKRANIRVYAAFEAKVLNTNGEVDIPIEAEAMADFVVASVHRLPVGRVFKYPREMKYDELAKLEKELSIAAIHSAKNIYVLGHCGGMTIATYGRFPMEYFEDIIQACRNSNVAFEFNYKYHYKYENELKKLLSCYNPYISVGSDAHEISKVSDRSFL